MELKLHNIHTGAIDSALKKTEKNDKNSNENEDSREIEEINISWSQFKKQIN